MDGHNSIFCTLAQCQALVTFFTAGSGIIRCMADLNLISSGIERIPETSFVGEYIEPFIYPLTSNECGTLSHILSADIWIQSIIQMSKWPNLNSKMHKKIGNSPNLCNNLNLFSILHDVKMWWRGQKYYYHVGGVGPSYWVGPFHYSISSSFHTHPLASNNWS